MPRGSIPVPPAVRRPGAGPPPMAPPDWHGAPPKPGAVRSGGIANGIEVINADKPKEKSKKSSGSGSNILSWIGGAPPPKKSSKK